MATDGHGLVRIVDPEVAGAGDARPAHAAGHHRGVAGHAAAGWSECRPRHACRGCPRGLVSTRTRITSSPLAARSSASSAENTALPLAAPGLAGRPRAITSFFALGSRRGCKSWSSEAGSTRATAVCRSIRPSSQRSTATFSAACAVRLPLRGLQHIELALLHGELDVLHVAVMPLELVPDLVELLEDLGHHLFHRRQRRPGSPSCRRE